MKFIGNENYKHIFGTFELGSASCVHIARKQYVTHN